jgi:hypothetical protein
LFTQCVLFKQTNAFSFTTAPGVSEDVMSTGRMVVYFGCWNCDGISICSYCYVSQTRQTLKHKKCSFKRLCQGSFNPSRAKSNTQCEDISMILSFSIHFITLPLLLGLLVRLVKWNGFNNSMVFIIQQFHWNFRRKFQIFEKPWSFTSYLIFRFIKISHFAWPKKLIHLFSEFGNLKDNFLFIFPLFLDSQSVCDQKISIPCNKRHAILCFF